MDDIVHWAAVSAAASTIRHGSYAAKAMTGITVRVRGIPYLIAPGEVPKLAQLLRRLPSDYDPAPCLLGALL